MKGHLTLRLRTTALEACHNRVSLSLAQGPRPHTCLLLSIGAAETLRPAHHCLHSVWGVPAPSCTCLVSLLPPIHTLPTGEGVSYLRICCPGGWAGSPCHSPCRRRSPQCWCRRLWGRLQGRHIHPGLHRETAVAMGPEGQSQQ